MINDIPDQVLDKLHEVAQGERPARGWMRSMFAELSDHEDHQIAIHLTKEEAFRLWGVLDVTSSVLTVSVQTADPIHGIRDKIENVIMGD